MSVIKADHLTKRFGKKVLAVDDVSFTIEPGTITGVLGPNGAGKTTTLRMILDLVRPTAGSVTILGSRYRELRAPAARVGALLDASGFHPGRSGRNALRVIADRRRRARRACGRDARARGAHSRRPPGREGLLHRYEATPGARRGPARRPRGAHPRRAGQRARPGGDPLAADFLRALRGGGPHRARVEPRALRGGADGERRRGHPAAAGWSPRGPSPELTASAQPVVRVRSPQAEKLGAALRFFRRRGRQPPRATPSRWARALPPPTSARRPAPTTSPFTELLTEQASLEDLFLQIAGTRREPMIALARAELSSCAARARRSVSSSSSWW